MSVIETYQKDEGKRNKLAQELCTEIRASNQAKGSLPQRWRKNWDIYSVVPRVTNLVVLDGMEPYNIPLWRPKADRIIGSTSDGLTSIYPYVQCIEEGQDGTNVEWVERDLMTLAAKAKFDNYLKATIRETLNTNLGTMRVRPVETKKGVKIQIDQIAPVDMVCYPAEFGSFDDAKTIGHRFFELKYRIDEKMRSGVYFQASVNGGDDPRTLRGRDRSNLDRTQSDEPQTSFDEYVAEYEVITERDLGEGVRKYICVVAFTDEKLLSIDETDYSWYVDFRTWRDDYIWPNDSVAQTCQGIQLAFCDAVTTFIHGTYGSAFPPVLLTGGSLNTKERKYGPGTVWESTEDIKLQTLPVSFNGQNIPEILELLEQSIDSLTGINRLGEGQNLPASTKATAIDALMQAQQEAKDNYTDSMTESLEKVWDLILQYYRDYKEQLVKEYGPSLENQGDIPENIRLQATATGGAASPTVMLNKLRAAQEIAQTPGSQYDPSKIEEKIMNALDLPFDTQGLKKDSVGMAVSELRMLMDSGIPPEAIMNAVSLGLSQMSGGAIGHQDQVGASPAGVQGAVMGGGAQGVGNPAGALAGPTGTEQAA